MATTKYKSLSKAESNSECSLNSSTSSKPDPIQETVLVIDGKESGPGGPHSIQRTKKKSVYIFRCRYCKGTFTSRQHGCEGLCPKAPNFAKENVDKLLIVKGYQGLWYHMTKDQLPHEENEDVNILRLDFPQRMGISLWIKYILISIFCLPCICLWFPFALWERQTRSIYGPRHSIRRKRKEEDPPKKSQPQSTSSEPPNGPQTSTTPLLLPTPKETKITIEPSGPPTPPPVPECPPPSSEPNGEEVDDTVPIVVVEYEL